MIFYLNIRMHVKQVSPVENALDGGGRLSHICVTVIDEMGDA